MIRFSLGYIFFNHILIIKKFKPWKFKTRNREFFWPMALVFWFAIVEILKKIYILLNVTQRAWYDALSSHSITSFRTPYLSLGGLPTGSHDSERQNLPYRWRKFYFFNSTQRSIINVTLLNGIKAMVFEIKDLIHVLIFFFLYYLNSV